MFNTIAFLVGTTLMYSTPLIFTALGGVISENSGVINIGLEGMMSLGAFVAAAVGYFTGNPWLGLLAGGLAGGILALFHAIASVSLSADQTVSGIAINFIGPGLALFLSRKFFEGATMTKPLTLEQKVPKLFTVLGIKVTKNTPIDMIFNQDLTVILAMLLTVALWFLFYRTKYGLHIRSVGEHPKAADTLGINVYKVRYFCVITSGILAGIGGGAMSIAVTSHFTAMIISGHGFIAMAAMIFGKWKPHGAFFACIIFGFAQALVITIGGTTLNISSQLLAMLPYVLTLIILTGLGRAAAPAANGVPYET